MLLVVFIASVLSMLFKLFGCLFFTLKSRSVCCLCYVEFWEDIWLTNWWSKIAKFLFLSLQTSHVIRQLRYHSDRRPRRRPRGLKIYQRSVFNLTSKLYLLLFLRNHPFIGLQGPSKHQGLDLRERIKYRWTTAVSCAMAPKFPSGLGSPR